MTESEVIFRPATHADLLSIVRLLADDDLGSTRERYQDPLPESYFSAFEQIKVDSNHELIVAERDDEVGDRACPAARGTRYTIDNSQKPS